MTPRPIPGALIRRTPRALSHPNCDVVESGTARVLLARRGALSLVAIESAPPAQSGAGQRTRRHVRFLRSADRVAVANRVSGARVCLLDRQNRNDFEPEPGRPGCRRPRRRSAARGALAQPTTSPQERWLPQRGLSYQRQDEELRALRHLRRLDPGCWVVRIGRNFSTREPFERVMSCRCGED
jgi:hypothetical protein